MNPQDLIARCLASIADDKKHGLTYRTCRAEDFEALVELAVLAAEAREIIDEWECAPGWLRRYDALAASGSGKEKQDA